MRNSLFYVFAIIAAFQFFADDSLAKDSSVQGACNAFQSPNEEIIPLNFPLEFNLDLSGFERYEWISNFGDNLGEELGSGLWVGIAKVDENNDRVEIAFLSTLSERVGDANTMLVLGCTTLSLTYNIGADREIIGTVQRATTSDEDGAIRYGKYRIASNIKTSSKVFFVSPISSTSEWGRHFIFLFVK